MYNMYGITIYSYIYGLYILSITSSPKPTAISKLIRTRNNRVEPCRRLTDRGVGHTTVQLTERDALHITLPPSSHDRPHQLGV